MTDNNYFNTIEPLVSDLDENIISNVSVDNADGSTTTITFHNPVTGSTDRVIFEGQDPNNIQSIYYVIAYSIDRINEELIMDDLADLYDFILMDEEQ
jgi:hypothetical protein